MTKTTGKMRCPRCANETSWEGNPNRPFCSERCRLIDLGCWADEDYRIAGEKASPTMPDNLVEFPQAEKDQH